MKYEVWDNVIKHLFVMCGIRKMSEAEHALYISDLFSELKNKFTDNEIGIAARQIAENENLYGGYPSLSLWLKYCPQRRANQIADNTLANDFISVIHDIVYCDFLYSGFWEVMQKNIESFGARGQSVIEQFGGIKSIFVNYNKASDFLKEQFMREVRRAWDDSAIASAIGALQIAAQKPLALEGKNEK